MDTLRVGFNVDTSGAIAAVRKFGSATSAAAEAAGAHLKASFVAGAIAGLRAVDKLKERTASLVSTVATFQKQNGTWATYKAGVDKVNGAFAGAAGSAKKYFGELKLGQKLKEGASFWMGFYGMQALTGAIGGAIDVYKELKTESRTLAAAFGLSGADADKFAAQLKLLKAESGLTSEQLTLGYQQLAAAGLKARDSSLVLAATADVQARVGDAAAESFKKTAANIAKVGVTPEAISGLREAGFSLDEMAKALNLKGPIKNFQQLNAAVAVTKTTSKEALNGMLKLVSTKFDKGGLLGGAAKELADQSLEKQLDNLKRAFGDLFTKIDLTPITSAMVSLREQLNGDLGDKLRVAITQIGNATIKLVPLLIGAVSMFGRIAASPMTKWIVIIVGSLLGLAKVVTIVTTVVSAISAIGGAVTAVSAVVLGLVGWPLLIAAGLVAAGYAIYKYWDEIKAFFASAGQALWETMKSMGSFVMDGLVWGMKAGMNLVTDAVTGIGDKVRGTFKAVMHIRSPSRVMAADSVHIPGGVAVGIESGTDKVVQASAGLAQAARDGFAAGDPSLQAPSVQASAGRGASTNNINITVNIDGTGGDAESIGDAIEQRMRDIARQLFGEVNAIQGSFA